VGLHSSALRRTPKRQIRAARYRTVLPRFPQYFGERTDCVIYDYDVHCVYNLKWQSAGHGGQHERAIRKLHTTYNDLMPQMKALSAIRQTNVQKDLETQ
jgi:hypothetical protein